MASSSGFESESSLKALLSLAADNRATGSAEEAVWMAMSYSGEKITMLEEAALTAQTILPKYDCVQINQRIVFQGQERQVTGVQVKAKALGKLLSGLLFREGKKVLIYQQKGGPGGGGGPYQLKHSASPGDWTSLTEYMADVDEADDELGRPVAALTVEEVAGASGSGRVALFIVDKASKLCRICSFVDNPEFDLLDSVLEAVHPLEIRVVKAWKDGSEAGKVLGEKGLAVVRCQEKPCRNFDAAVRALGKLVDFSAHDLCTLEKDESQAVRTGAMLTDVMAQMVEAAAEDEEGTAAGINKKKKFSLELLSTSRLMRLFASTLEGLHVFDGGSSSSSGGGGAKSLFGILNRTRTAGGERLLRSWLRQPLLRAEDIRRRLDVVDCIRSKPGLKKTLHETKLRRVPDLQKIYKKMQSGRLTLADLYKAYCAVKESAKILALLEQHFGQAEGDDDAAAPLPAAVAALREDLMDPLSACLPKLSKYEQLCEKTLDDDALREGDFRVRASFDDTLASLGAKLTAIRERMTSLHRDEARRLGLDPTKVLKLESSAQHGYYFRVTLKDERMLRQKKDVRVFDSTKAGVKFRSKLLDSANVEFEEATKNYASQQQYLVDEILQIADGYGPHFLSLHAVVSRMDCLVAFAVAADSAAVPYVKPVILDGDSDDDGALEFLDARHPILEQMSGISFIPNDVRLDRKDASFKIITGPNLGGKSTYMRTAGLCVLMCQVGSFVPCSSARVSPVDALLVRMGASDSQRRGVSTFMAEMLDASRLIRDSTKRSLVLIDELGRGTSTYDGFGLAWAIAQEIAAEIQAFGLCATHFHELTRLEQCRQVSNLYCDAIATDHEFTLLYAIKPGVCRKSFGIEVARMAGFPAEVLQDARRYLTETESELKGVFRRHEEMRDILEKAAAAEEEEDQSGGSGGKKRKKEVVAAEARRLAKKMKEEEGGNGADQV